MGKKSSLLLFIFMFSFCFSKSRVKVLNKTIIPELKYAVDYEISFDKGKFPTEEYMEEVSRDEIINNLGYENYFIHFYLPGMKPGAGAYAVSNNFDKVKILYYIMINEPKYSKYLKYDSDGNYYFEDYENYKVEEKIDKLEKIGSKIKLDYQTINGKIKLVLKTNLPENMKLMASLEGQGLISQSKIIINENGYGESLLLSNKGYRLKEGEYNVSITSPYPSMQPENVVKIIGKDGKLLKSKITYKELDTYFIEFKKVISIKY